MNKLWFCSLIFFVNFLILPVFSSTNEQIKQEIIQKSIDNYPGNCPCPYNTMRNGRACGGRSAYRRAGGYSPLCYKSDISKQMIDEYRKKSK